MIREALAQTTAATAGSGNTALIGQFLPLILVFAVFYFLLIRPQQRQQKLHRRMISEAKRGDEIVTSGGIHGKVVEIQGDQVKIEIADGVQIKLDKGNLQTIKNYKPAGAPS